MSSMGKAKMGTGELKAKVTTKAAEMLPTNQLIDDYTLKGAKGLLVNITKGSKLFEVDRQSIKLELK